MLRSHGIRTTAMLLMGLLVLAAFAACGPEPRPASEPTATQTVPTATVTMEATATSVPLTTATSTMPTTIPTPAPSLTPDGPDPLWERFADVPTIVGTSFAWPRTVRDSSGPITLEKRPARIHSLSLGHDEMIVALAGTGRLAGVGTSTANADYSNIADRVQHLPQIGRDAEQVIALEPDIVIASKFTNQDLIDLITGAGIQVFRSELESSAAGNISNILTLGYMLGEEEAAARLVDEIEARLAFVGERVPSSGQDKVRVVSMARFTDLRAAGLDSTEGGIIEAAGGINVANFSGHQTISSESIVAMNPDFILIPQSGSGAPVLRDELLADPVLQEVPAIKNGNVHAVNPTFFTTLSHWNVRGIEEAAKMFYPEQFEGVEFEPFE